jgi:hypothetical protein
LCGIEITAEHGHLCQPDAHRIVCCCQACGILFQSGRLRKFRWIPRSGRSLPQWSWPDETWKQLEVPAGLAFLFRNSVADQLVGVHPSPAGAVEFSPSSAEWQRLCRHHAELQTIRDDVEALLVNRGTNATQMVIAPIDRCYELVGIVRKHWSGITGGQQVQQQIRNFIDGLDSPTRHVRDTEQSVSPASREAQG